MTVFFRTNDNVICVAVFKSNGLPKTGLTDVVCTVWRVTESGGSAVTVDQPAQEIGGGLYRYIFPDSLNTQQGLLIAQFKTNDPSVDEPHVYVVNGVGYWAQNLDAPVSTRAPLHATAILAQPSVVNRTIKLYFDDNVSALGTQITLTFKNTPVDYSSFAVSLYIGGALIISGSVSGTATQITVVFTITEAQKRLLGAGSHPYSVRVQSGTQTAVLQTGTVIIQDTP